MALSQDRATQAGSNRGPEIDMSGPFENFLDAAGTEDSDEYQAFLNTFSNEPKPNDREILRGRVLTVAEKEVIVDIGRKIEGLVPASQFPQADGLPAVKPGEVIEVMFDRTGEQVAGYILL